MEGGGAATSALSRYNEMMQTPFGQELLATADDERKTTMNLIAQGWYDDEQVELLMDGWQQEGADLEAAKDLAAADTIKSKKRKTRSDSAKEQDEQPVLYSAKGQPVPAIELMRSLVESIREMDHAPDATADKDETEIFVMVQLFRLYRGLE